MRAARTCARIVGAFLVCGALGLVGGAIAAAPAAAGVFGDSPPSRIPVPAKNFSATVEDEEGMRVELTQVSYDGEVFLYGDLGAGQVTVPFDTIAVAGFAPGPDDKHKRATVSLKDGGTVELEVDAKTPTYGRTSFGNYSIAIGKVRKIEFR